MKTHFLLIVLLALIGSWAKPIQAEDPMSARRFHAAKGGAFPQFSQTAALDIQLKERLIDWVVPEGSAYNMGVRPGDQPLAWKHGSPDSEASAWVEFQSDLSAKTLAQAMRAILAGQAIGDVVSLKVQRGDDIKVFSGPLQGRVEQVGMLAPPWPTSFWYQWDQDKGGWVHFANPPSLQDWLDQGKVVFFYGFQEACPNCHGSRGFPLVESLYKEYGQRGDVIFVVGHQVYESHRGNTESGGLNSMNKFNLQGPNSYYFMDMHDYGMPDRLNTLARLPRHILESNPMAMQKIKETGIDLSKVDLNKSFKPMWMRRWGLTGSPVDIIIGRDGRAIMVGTPNAATHEGKMQTLRKYLDQALAQPMPEG